MIQLKKSCYEGNHNLKLIFSVSNCYGEEKIVKWCPDCGAIRVDIEYDNRIRSGKMEFPKLLYDWYEELNKANT